MKNIKSVKKRAMEYALKWNEFRNNMNGKQFVKNQLFNYKLPYCGAVTRFICNSPHYTKHVGFVHNTNYKLYEFTENPIHYSIIENIINESVIKQKQYKLDKQITSSFGIKNKEAAEKFAEDHNREHFGIYADEHFDDGYPEIYADNEGNWYTKDGIENVICNAYNEGNSIESISHSLRIKPIDVINRLFKKGLIINSNSVDLSIFNTSDLVKELHTNRKDEYLIFLMDFLNPAQLVEWLREGGFEVTAKKTIEL